MTHATRSCGTCTYCCRLPDIEALEKPANDWCGHCRAGEGCVIYAERPQLCRDFVCHWITGALEDAIWQPERAKMMVYGEGAQLTVLVDPDYPDAWTRPPYADALQTLANRKAAEGGYLILFVGDHVVKIEAEVEVT